MATVNIPSYHDDPNYRYKMPRVKAKVEGRGNGVKTNIMNMGDIGRALKRPPEYATKFCGCELGASSKFESAEGKAIVNGIHTEADVQTVIDRFVERFVLCPKCRLPEVDLAVHGGRVQGTCNACGHTGDMDNSHKVATFIVKNPPAVDVSTVGKQKPGEKSRKAAARAEGSSKSAADGKTSAAKKEKQTSSTKKRSHHHHHHHHHHEKQSLNFDSEEIANVIERLAKFLSRGERPTFKDFFQELRLLQVAQDFNGTLRVYCALSALQLAEAKPPPELTPDRLQSYAGYLAATCDRSIDGEMILEALENYVHRCQPESCWSQFAVLLSKLYQEDILNEDAILKRYAARQPTSDDTVEPKTGDEPKAVDEPAAGDGALRRAREAAATFVRWLEEAESASSSDDGEPAVSTARGPVKSSSSASESEAS